MWFSFWTIGKKEMRDAVRDKRALRLAFLPPVYMIVFFSLVIGFTIHWQNSETQRVVLPVSGGSQAPELINWLQENQVTINNAPTNPAKAIRTGKINYALVIPVTKKSTHSSAEPLHVGLLYNASKQNIQTSLNIVRQLIQQYNRAEASINVMARGLSPKLLSPIIVRESNLASKQQMGGLILGSVPLLLLMCTMMGSIGFAADMTAGERERCSLEPLLINPVSRGLLVLGKWWAAVLLTLAVVSLCAGLLLVALYCLPFNQIGLRVSVGPLTMLTICWTLIPVAAIAAALQLLLGVISRSFKDAQTYMSILIVLPMVPFFIVFSHSNSDVFWQLWVPLLGQQIVLKALLLGEQIPDFAYSIFWLSAAPLTAGILWLAARQLHRGRL